MRLVNVMDGVVEYQDMQELNECIKQHTAYLSSVWLADLGADF